jgi:CII-binding regulator of phage lambda lysogenization HflD
MRLALETRRARVLAAAQEARFRMVKLRSPARARQLRAAAREGVRAAALYRQLSGIHLPAGTEGDKG